MELAHANVTEKVIGAAHTVHNTLGGGFLEYGVRERSGQGKVIIEAKAVSLLQDVHEVQLVNYLKGNTSAE